MSRDSTSTLEEGSREVVMVCRRSVWDNRYRRETEDWTRQTSSRGCAGQEGGKVRSEGARVIISCSLASMCLYLKSA